ncbi:hypothetical protein METHB2_240030 [Candidatus Methylobacter favarea]|uniref:Uncharacterized protein n=1 Tax=Candidatus Methylobacter favarea TaxID=2707345 RepID=A0A8S0XFQ4_9GAMM|nr:hypothetical protein [Candidatus Methylobacter favarea]CAA9890557.1 hypothetical protein METHB2_240030 [Candidatus Methylobacter favarea]
MNHCKLIVEEIIATTLKFKNMKEVEITQKVSSQLKDKKIGLFQNEVDYRVLLPEFTPDDGHNCRGDLVGFSHGRFVLAEYKIYDENLINKNPWGVFYYFMRDRLKLESAIRYNSQNLPGHVMQICVIRNTDCVENDVQNDVQIELILEHFKISNHFKMLKNDQRVKYPSLKGAKYLPILQAFKKFPSESTHAWEYSFKSRGSTAFLIGIAEFNAVVS